MINIILKIEGFREKSGIHLQVKPGATISETVRDISDSDHVDAELVRSCFYNKKDGSIGVYMVLVNTKMVPFAEFDNHKLSDGDEITIIMPIAGG